MLMDRQLTRMVAQLLNLALTRKSKQATDLEDMCGFPLTSLDFYVEKLVRVCSSLELSEAK